MSLRPMTSTKKGLHEHLRMLAGDEMEGRQSDTTGTARARAYLAQKLADYGAVPLFPGYRQPFPFRDIDDEPAQGVNIVGLIRGTTEPEVYLTLSAHYDHLGR